MSLQKEDLVILVQKTNPFTIKNFFIRKGIDIDFLDYDGKNALMILVEKKMCAASRRLVQAGADVNGFGKNGCTALLWACRLGCVDCVRILLDIGACIDLAEGNGETPLMTAVKNNHDSCVRVLLSYFTARENFFCSLTNDPYGFVASKKMCMMAGAQVNVQCKLGITPLMLSVGHYCKGTCLDILLKADADPSLQDNEGKTALMHAIDFDDDSERDTESSEFLRKLINAGAHVNAVNVSGQTALMIASHHSLKKCVEILLVMGADANMKDEKGKTALMMAAQGCGEVSCLTQLINAKADVSCKDNDGWTALMHSVNTFDYIGFDDNDRVYEKIATLLRAGADIDAVNSEGQTALMIASNVLFWQCGRFLMRFKPNVNLQDKQGQTALMVLARSHEDWNETRYEGERPDSESMAELLISHGADPDIKDKDGITPLVHSLREPDPYHENAIMFLNHGAEPVLEDKDRHLITTFSSGWAADEGVPENTAQFIRFLVCNGYVKEKLCEKDPVTPFQWALREKCMSTLSYLISNFYLTNGDLSAMRAYAPLPYRSNDEFCNYMTLTTSNPWPLVRLAFIAVSTHLGPSPQREKRIPQTGLPLSLQRMLRFETPIKRLSTHHWHEIPLNFDNENNNRHHAFTSLIHSWPFSDSVHVAHCKCYRCKGIGYNFP